MSTAHGTASTCASRGALEELPVMTAAFAAGQLSYSKVRAMTRVATPKSETDLVAVALHGTASHVDRIVAGYQHGEAQHGSRSRPRQLRRRGVWYETADDGTVTITDPRRSRCDRAHPPGHRRRHAGARRSWSTNPTHRTRPAASTGSSTSPGRTSNPTSTPRPAPRSVDPRRPRDPDRGREPGGPRSRTAPSLSATTLERLACDCGLRLAIDERGADARHRPTVPHHPARAAPGDRRPRPGHVPLPGLHPSGAAADPPPPALVARRADQEAEPVPRLPLPPQGAARRWLARRPATPTAP